MDEVLPEDTSSLLSQDVVSDSGSENDDTQPAPSLGAISVEGDPSSQNPVERFNHGATVASDQLANEYVISEQDENDDVEIEPESLCSRGSVERLGSKSHDHTDESPSPSSGTPCATPGAEENKQVLNITCGSLSAKLYTERFLCPGIHQLCVEFQGEFCTPKQFTVVAAKDKQKDWKGSIKIERIPLRTLMERKQIDFYQHDKYCSGKCASKNYRAIYKDEFPYNSPEIFQQTLPAYSSSGSSQVNPILSSPGMSMGNYLNTDYQASAPDLNSFVAAATAFVKTEPSNTQSPTSSSDQGSSVSSRGLGPVSTNPANPLEGISQPSGSRNSANGNPELGPEALLIERPFQFWQNVFNLGLFDDLVSEIGAQIEHFKVLFCSRPELREKIAQRLSATVGNLEITEHIGRTLQTKRMLTRAETDILTNEIEELKRRTDEQKRRQLEAKRRSELFDELFQKRSLKSAKLMEN